MTKDLLCVRDIAGKSSNKLLLLLILKKFHLKPTVLKSLFDKVSYLRACNFFAQTVNSLQPFTIFTKSFIVDIWHVSKYASDNTDVCKDPSDYGSSCPEVFSKKGVSSVFCSALEQPLKIPSKKLSPIPLYTHFENF